MKNPPNGLGGTPILLRAVVVVVIPAALRRGKRAKVIVTREDPPLARGSRRRSWRGQNYTYMDYTCAKGIRCRLILAIADQVMIQLEPDDDGRTLQPSSVKLRLYDDAVLVICWQRIYSVRLCGCCECFCSLRRRCWPRAGIGDI